MIRITNKPRVLFLTRKKPESIFLLRKLKNMKGIDLIGTIAENNNKGKLNLVVKKFKYFFFKYKFNKLIVFLINLPFLFIIDRYRSLYFYKRWKINNKEIFCKNNFFVEDLNSKEAQKFIKIQNPDIILIFGTGILVKETFSLSKLGSINIHTGITPEYRGAKSEFWAILNNDRNMLGYTIHKVDIGIDTGEIIFQKKIKFKKKESLLSTRARNIEDICFNLEKVLIDYSNKNIKYIKSDNRKSKLYSTPYLHNYITIFINKLKDNIKI
tara:strand:+ start:13138 stop:13944 length:807 start_codon:yes stop_codon:yes gene_type:complete